MPLTEEQATSFWAMVDRSGECWLWRPKWKQWRLKAKGPQRPASGRRLNARYIAWELAGNPPLAAGSFLNVTCKSKSCLRHLAVSATRRGGKRHRHDKGILIAAHRKKIGTALHVRGEDHGRGKLMLSHVRAILRSSESGGALAKRFGVTAGAIWQIRKRRTWRQLHPNS